MSNTTRDLFPLGRVFYTRGVVAVLDEFEIKPLDLLERHQRGDWGDLCAEDRKNNRDQLQRHGCILSIYHCGEAPTIWIKTYINWGETTVYLEQEN